MREPFTRNHLFGDWGGMCTIIWQQGLDVQLLLISDPYGNSRDALDQGFTTYSMVSADRSVDAEKLLVWKGATFQVGLPPISAASSARMWWATPSRFSHQTWRRPCGA